jgi:hypothetical protein
MVLSNITPGADFRTGEGELFQQGERLLDKYAEANKTNLIRRAQQRGAIEGAAVADGSPMPERGFLFTGDVAEARTAGADALTLHTARTNRAAQRLYESLGWKRDEEFCEYSLRLDPPVEGGP